MFPWLRLFGVGLSLIGKSKVDVLATTPVRLRVWPNDLDYNLHVNNGRYLALCGAIAHVCFGPLATICERSSIFRSRAGPWISFQLSTETESSGFHRTAT